MADKKKIYSNEYHKYKNKPTISAYDDDKYIGELTRRELKEYKEKKHPEIVVYKKRSKVGTGAIKRRNKRQRKIPIEKKHIE